MASHLQMRHSRARARTRKKRERHERCERQFRSVRGKPSLRRRIAVVYAGLIGANLVAWTWAAVAFHAYPALLGMAALA